MTRYVLKRHTVDGKRMWCLFRRSSWTDRLCLLWYYDDSCTWEYICGQVAWWTDKKRKDRTPALK